MKRVFVFAFLFVSIAALLSIGLPTESSRAADGTKITVAYSSNVMGYTEPCG
ncbi:MAG: hypothetical protein GXX84_07095 [Acidobacteria bacterium]|nr:hypothetical protein [Acidobacteriota bacterium]